MLVPIYIIVSFLVIYIYDLKINLKSLLWIWSIILSFQLIENFSWYQKEICTEEWRKIRFKQQPEKRKGKKSIHC